MEEVSSFWKNKLSWQASDRAVICQFLPHFVGITLEITAFSSSAELDELIWGTNGYLEGINHKRN